MTTFRIEFTIEDYIIEDWCDNNGYGEDEFEDHVHEFIDDHIQVWPDDVVIL